MKTTPPLPRYFYIYDIQTEKILAVYGSALGQEASEAYSKLLQNHGPHVLLCARRGERRYIGETIPGF